MRRFIICCLGVLALLVVLSAAPALAATRSATFAVTATVVANCTISATPISFGNYDPVLTHSSADLDADGTVTVRCSRGTSANIGLDLGSNFTGTTRRMVNAGEYLTYEIYSDAGRTTVWGNTAGSWVAHTPVGPPNQATYTMYGRVPQAQDVPPNTYSDTVTATVNY